MRPSTRSCPFSLASIGYLEKCVLHWFILADELQDFSHVHLQKHAKQFERSQSIDFDDLGHVLHQFAVHLLPFAFTQRWPHVSDVSKEIRTPMPIVDVTFENEIVLVRFSVDDLAHAPELCLPCQAQQSLEIEGLQAGSLNHIE